MTLVELSVSMLVLIVAVGATLGSISSATGLEETNRQTVEAFVAARRVIETMQSGSVRQVFALYNEYDNDDPGVWGSAPGSDFAVPGFDPQDDDPDGFVGEIILPIPTKTTQNLREDYVDASLGFPRDLNADGVIDAANHQSDYVVLPVRVRIQWKNSSGNRSIELQTLLANR